MMLLLLVGSSGLDAADERNAFEEFKTFYKKTYPSLRVEEQRLSIFSQNTNAKSMFNSKKKQYTIGINHIAYLTQHEFAALMTVPSMFSKRTAIMNFNSSDLQAAPGQVDWREKGVVNKVRNQYQCGACWVSDCSLTSTKP
jgi:C1A family cysteine protease